LDIYIGVLGRIRWVGYVEPGGFVGIVWRVLDVENDCGCRQ
jgi:hypothetical protein